MQLYAALLRPDGVGIVISGVPNARTTVTAVHSGCKTFFSFFPFDITTPPHGDKMSLQLLHRFSVRRHGSKHQCSVASAVLSRSRDVKVMVE